MTMEKLYESKSERSKPNHGFLVPILILIVFILSCCLFVMTYTSLVTTTESHQHNLDVQNTIVEKVVIVQTTSEHLSSRTKTASTKEQNLLFHPKSLGKIVDPEMNMTACQIANRWGYRCESHTVTTEDGYILTVHRMPSTNSNSTSPYPVFLQHGLLSSSTDWLDNLPNTSLSYILANNGYDVWMGNFRGNFYSRRHQTLDPEKRPFWRFSWDEMAAYDLPAMINYVLNVTGSRDLFYAGHSQGTMTAFAQFAQNQKLGERIRMFFALAPVTTVGHMTDYGFNALSHVANQFRDILYLVGFKGEFLPRGTRFITWMNKNVCATPFLEFLCNDVLWALAGIQSNELNTTRIPVYISQIPAGTSLENMVHFAQMVKSKKFQKYDFGSSALNMEKYNQSTPPLYDVSQLKTPVTIYWGGKDWLADPQDVLGLLEKLHHIEHSKFVANYDHLDFMWAQSAPKIIFNDMLQIMHKKLHGSG